MAPKGWSDSALFVDIPFMDQMGYTALLTMLFIVLISYVQHKGKDDEKGIEISKETFKTSPVFNIGSMLVMLVLVALYAFFWN